MAGLKWSSNSNNTLLTILPSTTPFEKFVLISILHNFIWGLWGLNGGHFINLHMVGTGKKKTGG